MFQKKIKRHIRLEASYLQEKISIYMVVAKKYSYFVIQT